RFIDIETATEGRRRGDGSQFETIDSPCRLAAGTNGKTYRGSGSHATAGQRQKNNNRNDDVSVSGVFSH
ncbi:MAG: hypothetical protein KDH08_19380, partial [Anaerolineae bacterium]|nr:hypothetical protein [Anaerolineae bacterium]